MPDDFYIHKTSDSSYVVSDSVVPPVSPFGGGSELGAEELIEDWLPWGGAAVIIAFVLYVMKYAGAPWLGAIAFLPSVLYWVVTAFRTKGVSAKVWSTLFALACLAGFIFWGVGLGH